MLRLRLLTVSRGRRSVGTVQVSLPLSSTFPRSAPLPGSLATIIKTLVRQTTSLC